MKNTHYRKRARKKSFFIRKGQSFFSFCFVFLFLCLSGCSVLLSPGAPPVTLELTVNVDPHVFSSLRGTKKQIIVAYPETSASLDTDRISLLFYGREFKYLAGYRWTDTVGSMVQGNLLRTLEKSSKFSGVSREVSGVAGDIKILVDLQQFTFLYGNDERFPQANFQAIVQLLDMKTKRILGSTQIDTFVSAQDSNIKSLAQAMEAALGKGLEEISIWIDKKVAQQ